jgi:predicted protein tyrosine phosphatase
MTAARLYVCSLTKVVDTVRASGARSLVSILTAGASVARPREIAEARHLRIAVSDIDAAQDGHILAGRDHVERLLGFLHDWDRRAPLVIHCYAGVSRSPAAAFVAACALAPRRDELDLARELRRVSPTATPNRRLVALADDMLARSGRMNAAIADIGRGADCFEGAPFALELPRAQ